MHYLCWRKGQIILRHQPSRSRACGKNTILFTGRGYTSKPVRVGVSNGTSRLVVESVGVSWKMWSGSKLHKFYSGVSSETGTPMTFHRRVLEDVQPLDALKDLEV